MIAQEYLQVENNVVTNNVMWDGDINTWQPPADALMLITANTPAIVWRLDKTVTPNDWILTEVMGAGSVGFEWDGKRVITNEAKPAPQPKTSGTKSA
jgi:hypothetical protein